MVSPEKKRAAVGYLRPEQGASEHRACGLVGQPRSTQRYHRKAKPDDGLRERVPSSRPSDLVSVIGA